MAIAFGYTVAALGPAMPLLRDELDISRTVGGLHFTALAAGSVLAGSVVGRIVRVWGRHRVFWSGGAGVATGAVFIGTGWHPAITMFGCLVAGAFGSAVLITVQASLSDHHAAHRPVALTEANMSTSIGTVIPTMVIGGSVAVGFGWRPAFFVPLAIWSPCSPYCALKCSHPQNRLSNCKAVGCYQPPIGSSGWRSSRRRGRMVCRCVGRRLPGYGGGHCRGHGIVSDVGVLWCNGSRPFPWRQGGTQDQPPATPARNHDHWSCRDGFAASIEHTSRCRLRALPCGLGISMFFPMLLALAIDTASDRSDMAAAASRLPQGARDSGTSDPGRRGGSGWHPSAFSLVPALLVFVVLFAALGRRSSRMAEIS